MENEVIEIFTGKTVKAYLHKKERYLEITYTGGITTGEEYKSVCNKALDVAKENQIQRWLIDQAQMNVHPNELQWLFKEWLPRLIQDVGERRTTATVLAKNLFGEFATKQQISKNAMEDATHVNAGFFKTREEAIQWLLFDESNNTYN